MFASVKMDGAAAALFGKMVAAMGCAEGETSFEEVPPSPGEDAARALAERIEKASPKVLVLMGREAMVALNKAGGRVRRGAWGSFRSIPATATYHPAFMLRFWANDEKGLKSAKGEVWKALKEALASIGRVPPPVKKG